LPNRGPSAVIGGGGFGPASHLVFGRVDRIATPVAVAALGNIRDDQFVIDPAPERPALGLALFDSALAGHYAGAGRAWPIGRR